MIDEVRGYQATTEALSLRNIETVAEKVNQRIQGARNRLSGERDESKGDIERLMAGYLAKTGRDALKHEMTAQIGYLSQFERHVVELEKDGMPPLKARYRELMRGRLQIGVSQMRLEIDKAERDIEKRIQDLNGTLRFIDFTADTYIQLRHRSSSDQDVHTFNAKMKACMHGMQSPADQVTDDDRDKVFNALREMFVWADENPDRFNKAGDPRNAKHFHAEELYRHDNQRKFRHDDSQGKSGGEKAKLAYTILASAIAFQYNLKPGHTSDGFRLVLVDEIFSKLSETNAGFTMDLFRKFDLQLIMVMPMDSGLQLVQSFAKTFHVVSSRENKENGHVTSHIYSISSEDFRGNADLEKEVNAAS